MKATLIDGPETGHLHVGRARPYFQIGVVVALAVAILAAGFLGPHPTATPSGAPASPSAEPSNIARPEAALGLKLVRNVPGETVSPLPLQISSFAPHPVGNRLFFVVRDTIVESSVLGSTADPVVLMTVSHCQSINQIAAAEGVLMYLVTWPEQPKPAGSGCDTLTRIDWSLRLMDLGTGMSREVARGARPKIGAEVDGFPIHFAVTPSAYAFDRPDGETVSGPETVEVRSLAGDLLWTTGTYAHVVELELAGDRLAAVTQPWWPSAGSLAYSVASASRPTLELVSGPASSVSFSSDGLFAVWDVVIRGVAFGPSAVAADIDIGRARLGVSSALPPSASDQLIASNPVVASTPSGPFVAWLVTGPDAVVYPAFNWPDLNLSGFLESGQRPIWIGVSDSTLVWVAESSNGRSSVAYSTDISSLETV